MSSFLNAESGNSLLLGGMGRASSIALGANAFGAGAASAANAAPQTAIAPPARSAASQYTGVDSEPTFIVTPTFTDVRNTRGWRASASNLASGVPNSP